MPHRVFNLVEDITEESDIIIGKEIDLIYSKDIDEDLFEFPDIHIPNEEEVSYNKTSTSVTCNPDFCSKEDLDQQDKTPATKIKKVSILILWYSGIVYHPIIHLNLFFISIPIKCNKEVNHSPSPNKAEEKGNGQGNKEIKTYQKGESITLSLFQFYQKKTNASQSNQQKNLSLAFDIVEVQSEKS